MLLVVAGLFFYTTSTRGNIKVADCVGLHDGGRG